MNIKEIIDAERWGRKIKNKYYTCWWENDHNRSLDRIEAVATLNELMLDRFSEGIDERDKRIADLEAENARLREKLIIKST